MYKLVLIGICLFLLHMLVKRSESNKKVGCLLPLIVACAWLAMLAILFFDFAITRAMRDDAEHHATTATPSTEASKSIEWYQAAGKRPPE